MDGATSLSFAGRDYRGVWGGLFRIDRSTLTKLGMADQMNYPGSDGAVFRLPDVDPSRVVVVFHADGTFAVFVPAELIRADALPLGRAIPGLCRYFIDRPYECSAQPTATPP